MSINPRQLAIILKDNNGNVVNYLESYLLDLNWEWDRVGGCGACNMRLNLAWDSILAGSFAEDYEVNIFAPDISGTSCLWYSGFIDKVAPQVSGKDETIQLFCLGYVNQLKHGIVRDQTYHGEISNIVKDIVETYITSISKITSTAPNYEDSNFTADSIYFNESAYDAISKLADIAGKREWGVGADKAFFFKRRNDLTTKWFNITEDFINYTPTKDFNPIITGIYLIGGEGYNAKFNITNRITVREEIVSNSSIITQSVGQQYARMYLKEKGVPRLSFTADLVKQNIRVESAVPLGKAAVNIKTGIQNKYDDGSKYDSGIKYDGGTQYYQIERIRYSLQDEDINITLNFGLVPPNLADEMAKLEYLITEERNK